MYNCKSISVTSALKFAIPPDSFHPALSLSFFYFLPPLAAPAPLSFFNFSKADYPQIFNFFQ